MVDWKDDDGRRIGDWQHKDLRKNANDLVEDVGQKPWYQQSFWIVIFLLVFWPVGIVLCWRSGWPLTGKLLATILVLLSIAGMMWVNAQRLGLV
ncbi:MAG: holotricin-3 [Eggerthellaceae bacterium]|jgi:membrane protein YqaA with SNARE-associated domain|nr:holotricin-3 [Eggerthellaceae bacterium]MDR2722068.1 hypothetical protein [Coriobacteriaceae bacterium]